MSQFIHFVIFTLDEQRYALPLAAVARVVRVVEITPLPKAPKIVLGVINAQGQIIPVVNLRRRFHLLEREMNLSDQLVIAHTSQRPIALLVDSVTGLAEISEREVMAAQDILPNTEYVMGIVKLNKGLVLIHDLAEFLSLEEEQGLDQAMTIKVRNEPS
jgi:purine-binding chemotaxis protein CheW